MPFLELKISQIVYLIKQLSAEDKFKVMTALSDELQKDRFATDIKTREWLKSVAEELADRQAIRNFTADIETQQWLEAEWSEELPGYDWGVEGMPQGKPVRYIAGKGLTIEGGKEFV